MHPYHALDQRVRNIRWYSWEALDSLELLLCGLEQLASLEWKLGGLELLVHDLEPLLSSLEPGGVTPAPTSCPPQLCGG